MHVEIQHTRTVQHGSSPLHGPATCAVHPCTRLLSTTTTRCSTSSVTTPHWPTARCSSRGCDGRLHAGLGLEVPLESSSGGESLLPLHATHTGSCAWFQAAPRLFPKQPLAPHLPPTAHNTACPSPGPTCHAPPMPAQSSYGSKTAQSFAHYILQVTSSDRTPATHGWMSAACICVVRPLVQPFRGTAP